MQKFLAFGQVAHASIRFPDDDYRAWRDGGGKAFPIYVSINDGQWTIAENYSGIELPHGAQITHIDSVRVDEWLTRLHRYISADTEQLASSLLEFQLPQYLWLIAQDQGNLPDRYTLTLKTLTGKRDIIIPSLNRAQLQANIDAQTRPEEQTSELRTYSLLNSQVAYLKPGPFYNAESPQNVWDNTDFITFIDNAFNYFLEHDAKQLIIDVRQNPGGTNSFSDPLIAWFATEPFKFASEFRVKSSLYAKLSNEQRIQQSQQAPDSVSWQLAESYQKYPYGTSFDFPIEMTQPRVDKRFTGEVFVLIDRSSYSNAVSLAAIVKDYGFGTIIGESTVDFATTLASMESFRLDESGIEVGFPKAHIIRPSGDQKPGPVKPDIELESFELDNIAASLIVN